MEQGRRVCEKFQGVRGEGTKGRVDEEVEERPRKEGPLTPES